MQSENERLYGPKDDEENPMELMDCDISWVELEYLDLMAEFNGFMGELND